MDNFENQLKDNEIDSCSHSDKTSIENTSTDNVRNRVSLWLTEIVGEVRKKGVTVNIPKWVDSSNTNDLSENILNNKETKECDSLIAQNDTNVILINKNFDKSNEQINDSILFKDTSKNNTINNNEIETKSNIPSQFWNKFNFDKKQSNENPTVISNVNESRKTFQLKFFGKTKFNEIYDKVKLNKGKLPILKLSQTEMDNCDTIKEISNENDNQIESIEKYNNEFDEDKICKIIKENEPNENVDNNTTKIIQQNDLDNDDSGKLSLKEDLFENIIINENDNDNQINIRDYHENDLRNNENKKISFEKFKKNLKLAELGRSSTLNPKYLYSNDNSKFQFPSNFSSIEEEQFSVIPELISVTPNNKSRNIKLGGMCRSLSEQQAPNIIDESDEFFNERSHSFNVIKRDNSGSKLKNFKNEIEVKNDEQDEKNLLSSSLPIFASTNNIIQELKNPKQDSGHIDISGNSSSSLCMDISPCGSGSGASTSDPRDINSRRRNTFIRDNSCQSDSSHCSSVDSLLESRKPDPEKILINLGFGPIDSEDILAKIPKRFLKPSQVRGIDTEEFLQRQKLMNSIHDHSVLGYRGLLGNPDLPPSSIVAKIMERFEQNERNRLYFYQYNRPQSAPPNSMGIEKFNYYNT